MNPFQRALERFDRFQQRHSASAIAVAVFKKNGDDNGGALARQFAFSMFVATFPMLLLLVTVVGIVARQDDAIRAHILGSTFAHFPIVGHDLAGAIKPLHRTSLLSLAVGLIGLGYGAMGFVSTGLFTMAQVWQLPPDQRPDFWHRILRSLGFFGVLVIGIAVAAALSGFGTFGSHRALLALISEALATLVGLALYVALFRVFTPRAVATRSLLPGAIAGALMWTVLQAFGGYIVGHYLKGASATYGLFAVVLGLLAWLYLVAQTIVYAAQLNTVVSGHLWPRSVAGSVEPIQSPASPKRAA